MKHLISVLTILVGVLLGLASNAIYDKYKDEIWLSATITFAESNISTIAIIFCLLIVLLCVATYMTSKSADKEMTEARDEVKERFDDVRALVNRVALVPPSGFLDALEDYSKAYFSIPVCEEKWTGNNTEKNLSTIQNRLLIIATMANEFFEEHNSTFFVATLTLSVDTKDLSKEKSTEYEIILKFKNPGVSLSGLQSILLYESKLAVSTTRELTTAETDFCLPVYGLDEPQLPGAPSAFINRRAELYCSATDISIAAQKSGLAASVVESIKLYFEEHSSEIQSMISIPLHTSNPYDSELLPPVGVLSLHTNQATEHSDQRASLFVAHLQPFLTILSKEVNSYRNSNAILGKTRRKK